VTPDVLIAIAGWSSVYFITVVICVTVLLYGRWAG